MSGTEELLPCPFYGHTHTVEDVLREFVAEFIEYATCVDDHEVTDAISEYAPKLRLAGEDE